MLLLVNNGTSFIPQRNTVYCGHHTTIAHDWILRHNFSSTFSFRRRKLTALQKKVFLSGKKKKKRKKNRYVRRYIPLFHSPQRAICARLTCARLQWGVPASIPDCSFFPLPQVINLMDRKAQGHRVFVMERMSWGLGEPPFSMHTLPVSIRVLNANGYSRPRVLHHITPYSGGWLV